jgi:type IV pilus assembly protein PilX
MSAPGSRPRAAQRGMVLITSLLLLIVITLLALAMFHGNGLENLIAGNVMDKQRAVQAASSAQDYAEQWLVNNVATSSPAVCSAAMFTGATSPLICSNAPATPTSVPWTEGGSSYAPNVPILSGTTVNTVAFPVNTAGGVNQYYQAPTYYITQLGPDATVGNAVDYQVDAWTYAGAQSTVAVVESVYQIRYTAQGTGP